MEVMDPKILRLPVSNSALTSQINIAMELAYRKTAQREAQCGALCSAARA